MRRLFLCIIPAAIAAAASGSIALAQGRPQIILYQEDNYRGQQLVVDGQVEDLKRLHFNDRVSSVRVLSGSWLLCADDSFRGNCISVDRDVPKLDRMGFDDRLSSLRPVGNGRRDNRRGGDRRRD